MCGIILQHGDEPRTPASRGPDHGTPDSRGDGLCLILAMFAMMAGTRPMSGAANFLDVTRSSSFR